MKSLISLIIGLLWVNQFTVEINIVPYPDNSLYATQYQEFGMPLPDELWNASEYKRAVQVITGFYKVDKWSIPRKGSEYSGDLFERMIKLENFEIILDKSEPLQERLREHDELLRAVNQFLNMYMESNETEQRFGIEVLNLLNLSAHTTKYSIGVIKELQAIMSERGIRNSDLDLMHDKLIAGVGTSIEDNLILIEQDYKQYSAKDIEWFTVEIVDWALGMKEYLSENQVVELKNKISLIIDNHPNKNIRSSLKTLSKRLK